MKVIFLDIDGVLNCEQTTLDRVNKVKNNLPLGEFYQKLTANGDPISADIDEENVKILGKIVKLTGAKIVLTSSHRINWLDRKNILQPFAKALQYLFDKYNIEVIGVTPSLNQLDFDQRGNEIMAYLKEHDNIETFCIIDDENLGLQALKNHFIKTAFYLKDSNEGGLQNKHIAMALRILNKK